MTYLHNLLNLCLEAAPWLLLGFLAAGLIKAWIPEQALNRWLGGEGLWPVTKAALIGAPLPLCSCGVLPAALGLRRSGASKGSTLSFMIATPETGVDSVALSYVMLGPVMAVIRPIAAVLSAIATGLLVGLLDRPSLTIMGRAEPPQKMKVCSPLIVFPPPNPLPGGGDCRDAGGRTASGTAVEGANERCATFTVSAGGVNAKPLGMPIQLGAASCSGADCCSAPPPPAASGWGRTQAGLRYALVEMVDDLLLWLGLGLALAALILTLFEPMAMAEWGSGLPAMLLMLLVGIPMYICATASTPVAAALLFAGVSPGTVLVFLLAGPATNIASIGVIYKEMGPRSLWAYLLGISLCSVALGLLADWVIVYQGWDIQGQISTAGEWLPEPLVQASALILLLAVLNALWLRLRRWQGSARRAASCPPSQ
jgi:uncharacterized membrane protein YraQ (UPF0718 family)